jgi:hypothetical protein
MFNAIFVGTIGTIFVNTEIEVNNSIFGNAEINLTYKNTWHIQYVAYTTDNT